MSDLRSILSKEPHFCVGQLSFETLKDAQYEALKQFAPGAATNTDMAAAFAVAVLEHGAEIIAILTPPRELRSRAVRRDKGTKRGSRKPATIQAAA